MEYTFVSPEKKIPIRKPNPVPKPIQPPPVFIAPLRPPIETIIEITPDNRLPPSPIIFHGWFLHNLVQYFTIIELAKLSRVIQNTNLKLMIRFAKLGEK